MTIYHSAHIKGFFAVEGRSKARLVCIIVNFLLPELYLAFRFASMVAFFGYTRL